MFYESKGTQDKVLGRTKLESKMGRRSVCILSLVCLRLQFIFLLKNLREAEVCRGRGWQASCLP